MLTETLNDCIILPHLCNWAHPVRHKRSWATSVAAGIDGSEDRAAVRTLPLRKITYTVLGDGIQERSVLTERLKAALKSGRAVCPLFGRAQGCRPSGSDLEITQGLWPWKTGDYAFLCLPSKTQMNGINTSVLVDVGGDGTTIWQPELNVTMTGGSVATTANAIDVSGLTVTPPPQAVLQSIRSFDDQTTPDRLDCVLNVGGNHRTLVRAWFVYYEHVTAGKDHLIQAEGASVSSAVYEPWALCGETLFKAGYVDLVAWPREDGYLKVSIIPQAHNRIITLAALEVYSTCWQVLEIANAEQLDAMTLSFDPADVHFPDFADIPQIYPVLFGKPSVGDLESLTNWHGQIEIGVEEPLGDAASARSGVCQIEICGLPIETTPPPTGEPTPAVDQVYTGTQGFFIVWAGAPETLTQDQIDANKDWLEANKREYLIANPGTTFGAAYWVHRDTQESQWSAERYYQDGGELQQRIPTQYWGCWVLVCDATPP